MRMRPEPLEGPDRAPGALPVLPLPQERVVWLAAHAPLLSLALVLATLALVLALASMVQLQRLVVVRGVVCGEPLSGTDGGPSPEDEHAVLVDVSGASGQELQPGLAAVVSGNTGGALRGRVTRVSDAPGGCGGAVPCRRLRIRLDAVRPAGLMTGEVEVRLAIASRSMLAWLLESAGR